MRFRLFFVLALAAALAGCGSRSSSTSSTASSAPSAAPASSMASAPSERAAMVGTWACTGTINGQTSIRGYYLTLNANGTGYAQVRTAQGSSPRAPLKYTPWWASARPDMLTWKGPNHWVMTNFPGVHNLTIDCTRA